MKFLAVVIVCTLLNISQSMASSIDAMGTNRLRVSTCVRVGDMWAENWTYNVFKVATTVTEDKMVITLYSQNDEVWNYYCKITINDFSVPTWKKIKLYRKNNIWFPYRDCDIEFFYNVEYPSIEECFANYQSFVVNSKNTEAKKRVVKGNVILNPYFFTAGNEQKDEQKMHMTINCFFDEVAFAISFKDLLNFKKYIK